MGMWVDITPMARDYWRVLRLVGKTLQLAISVDVRPKSNEERSPGEIGITERRVEFSYGELCMKNVLDKMFADVATS